MKARILLLSIVILAMSSFAVFAQQNGTTTSNGNGSQSAAESQKCVDVTKKVDLVIARYNQNQEKYMNAFQNMYENMEQLATNLKANGYDTAKLEEDLNTYNKMMQNTSRYYNEFKTGIDNSKKGVCGNSDVDSGQEFNTARTQLMNAKDEMLQLRTFAQDTLRQDLLNLKTQISE